jgi:pimeloyl-ACP methyl ester carboxylesterase
MTAQTVRGATRVKGFNDEEFDFQLLRSLGVVPTGGAAVGEVLTVAARTRDGDPQSWVENFSGMADMVRQEADDCLGSGHQVSARELYGRASQYYRAAEYFENIDSERHDELGRKSRDAFHQAAALFDPPVEVVDVPYDPLPLPGYFARSGPDSDSAPTLIINGGFDSSGEELFFQFGVEALKRGINVFIFDGPGQTGMMRQRPRLPFRPDWEEVIRPVVDYVLARPGVETGRLALLGVSFGGYLAPRAAACDQRVRALIANSPIIDWRAYMGGFFGPEAAAMPDFNDQELREAPDQAVSPRNKQMLIHCFRKFGASSWHQYLETLQKYRLDPETMARIKCPVLACLGEGEGPEPRRQCQEFTEAVSGPVTIQTFSLDWGADAHCQVNNIARFGQRAYDWLGGVL